MTVATRNESKNNCSSLKAGEKMEVLEEMGMTDKEMMQKNVEEFSRLQGYMLLADKDSETYKAMKVRYIELKVILSVSGVNMTELDRIKE